MDWENHLEKNSDPKNRKKTVKSEEIAACEQKTTSEKAIFCSNTVFSLYFKFRAKKFHAAKPLAFSLHFLFQRDQNHYSNLTSKIIKLCEQILKKHSRTSLDVQFKEFSSTNRKLDQERMNGLGKPFKKNPIKKSKTKNQSEIAACEQETTSEKANFFQTPFSHSTLNLEQKKLNVANPPAFSLYFLFRRDQNHYPNLTSKIKKVCEQILKKT